MNKLIPPEEVGRRLRELRGIRTRTGAAKQIGISYSALSQYESGAKSPSDSTKVLLANYYGTSVQNLFFADNYHET